MNYLSQFPIASKLLQWFSIASEVKYVTCMYVFIYTGCVKGKSSKIEY